MDPIKDLYLETLDVLKKGIRVQHLIRSEYLKIDESLKKNVAVLLPISTMSRLVFDFMFKVVKIREIYPEQILIFKDEKVQITMYSPTGKKMKELTGIVSQIEIIAKDWFNYPEFVNKSVIFEFKVLEFGQIRKDHETALDSLNHLNELKKEIPNKIKMSANKERSLFLKEWPNPIDNILDFELQVDKISSDFLSNEEILKLKNKHKKFQIQGLRDWLKENAISD